MDRYFYGYDKPHERTWLTLAVRRSVLRSLGLYQCELLVCSFYTRKVLLYFDGIIPCGIEDQNKSVSSLEKELGHKVDMEDLQDRLKKIMQEIFEFKIV